MSPVAACPIDAQRGPAGRSWRAGDPTGDGQAGEEGVDAGHRGPATDVVQAPPTREQVAAAVDDGVPRDDGEMHGVRRHEGEVEESRRSPSARPQGGGRLRRGEQQRRRAGGQLHGPIDLRGAHRAGCVLGVDARPVRRGELRRRASGDRGSGRAGSSRTAGHPVAAVGGAPPLDLVQQVAPGPRSPARSLCRSPWTEPGSRPDGPSVAAPCRWSPTSRSRRHRRVRRCSPAWPPARPFRRYVVSRPTRDLRRTSRDPTGTAHIGYVPPTVEFCQLSEQRQGFG